MKRDLELLREILLRLEEDDYTKIHKITVETFVDPLDLSDEKDPFGDPRDLSPFEQEAMRISYHLQLLLDEGFIEATEAPILGRTYKNFYIKRMTSRGHDYLDSVRSPRLWKSIKDKLGDLAESASLATISALGQTIIKNQLGI